MSAIFEDFDEIEKYKCEEDTTVCDVMEREFPIREYLVPTLTELVVKELVGSMYKPVDQVNNASDDMSKVATKQS